MRMLNTRAEYWYNSLYLQTLIYDYFIIKRVYFDASIGIEWKLISVKILH